MTIPRRFMVYLYEIIFGERASFADFHSKSAKICGMSRLSMRIIPDLTSGTLIGPVLMQFVDSAGGVTNEFIGKRGINNTDTEVQEYLHGMTNSHTISFIGCEQDQAGNLTPTNVNFILVIEHENITKLFVDNEFHIRNKCILFGVSGSVTPAQRAWIYHLSRELGNIVVYGLCDQGPCGLSLLSNVTFSASAPLAEEEFSVPIRIINLRLGRNPNIPIGGALQGADFTEYDWNLLISLANQAGPFLANAHNRQRRDNCLAWMTQHLEKYQLQHVPVPLLIRQTELAIFLDRGM